MNFLETPHPPPLLCMDFKSCCPKVSIPLRSVFHHFSEVPSGERARLSPQHLLARGPTPGPTSPTHQGPLEEENELLPAVVEGRIQGTWDAGESLRYQLGVAFSLLVFCEGLILATVVAPVVVP